MSEHAKIQIRGEGIGEVDLIMVLRRASEIARHDGRSTPNDADIAHAREELLNGGHLSAAPETTLGTEGIVEWDDTPSEHGRQAVKVLPEDDGNLVEELVLEGNEEAEHDRRVESDDAEEDSED